MPSKMPKVSVILPVYNCEKYITETIQSVLNQTFEDFELLIIDDCSKDSTVEIIESFDDKRIQLFKKEKNTGYTNSLNYAISIAKGEYIARMDGDDICMPNRFEKQVEFLETHPSIILCGSAIQIIGENAILHHPFTHNEIKLKLCFANAFCHPSVMGRKEIFKDNCYDKNFEPAEDYDLWTRLVFKGELANLKEVLLLYRVHDEQVSKVQNEYQTTVGYSSQFRMFESLIDFEMGIYEKMHIALKMQKSYSINDFENSIRFLNLLQKENNRKGIYDKKVFRDKLKKIKMAFFINYFKAEGVNISLFPIYYKMLKVEDFVEMIKNRIKYLKFFRMVEKSDKNTNS